MSTAGTRPSPAPSAVRRRIRARREPRNAGTRSVGAYEGVLYAAVTGGLLAGALSSSYGVLTVRPQPWAVAAAGLATSAAAARLLLAVGPLVAGPAGRAWVLSTPVARRGLLAPRLAAVLAGAGALAGAAVVALAVMGGAPAADIAAVGACAVAWGASLAAVTIGVQSTGAALTPVLRACDLTVICCVVGILIGAAGGRLVGGAPRPPPAPVAAAALLFALAAATVAWARLERVHSRRLASGYALVRAAVVSVGYLDAGVVAGLARERTARAVGSRRPARIRGARRTALLLADLARIRRSPAGPVVLVLLVPVPALTAVLGAPALVGAVQAVCSAVAAHRLAGGLRLVGGSAALRRLVGGDDRSVLRVHLVWPAAGALVHVGLSSWLAPPGVGAALLSFAGAVAVVHRSATRPPLDYGGGAFDVGLLGPLPLGLALQVLRGPVLLAVLVGVQIALAAA